jgi:hypothetical protein
MKEPTEWFEDAVSSGKYRKDVISEIKSCISEEGFNIQEFMDWVSEQLEKCLDKDEYGRN